MDYTNSTKSRIGALVAVTASALALAQPAAAADASARENLGVAGGALIGALAGGPVGLVIGAALGGHHGASAHEAAKVPGLNAELGQARTSAGERLVAVRKLTDDVAQRDAQLAALNADLDSADRERAALLALRLDLLYTTGSADLSDSGKRQIVALAGLLSQMPDVEITLDGHADRRGSDNFNDRLSLARATQVRDALIAAGVDAGRVMLYSHGESAASATDGDLDAYALERRVSISLSGKDKAGSPAVVDNR